MLIEVAEYVHNPNGGCFKITEEETDRKFYQERADKMCQMCNIGDYPTCMNACIVYKNRHPQ